jgi:hypothetical protein
MSVRLAEHLDRMGKQSKNSLKLILSSSRMRCITDQNIRIDGFALRYTCENRQGGPVCLWKL